MRLAPFTPTASNRANTALNSVRPSLVLLGTEPLRASWEALRHLTAKRPQAATGHGHTVVLFPGLGSNSRAVWALKRHLNHHGFTAIDWGRGFNTGPSGDADEWLHALTQQVLSLAAAAGGEQLSLVGWSLGGFYAREVAKLVPSQVSRVVTIGTPFNAANGQTHVGWLFKLLNGRSPDARGMHQRLAAPPPVATTSIYSRNDGVVAWQACVHAKRHAHVSDIEVRGSHLGMGWNGDVLRLVSDELMRPG
jgi:pimeloyl-ACP methyl ester carboxylesterase